ECFQASRLYVLTSGTEMPEEKYCAGRIDFAFERQLAMLGRLDQRHSEEAIASRIVIDDGREVLLHMLPGEVLEALLDCSLLRVGRILRGRDVVFRGERGGAREYGKASNQYLFHAIHWNEA